MGTVARQPANLAWADAIQHGGKEMTGERYRLASDCWILLQGIDGSASGLCTAGICTMHVTDLPREDPIVIIIPFFKIDSLSNIHSDLDLSTDIFHVLFPKTDRHAA